VVIQIQAGLTKESYKFGFNSFFIFLDVFLVAHVLVLGRVHSAFDWFLGILSILMHEFIKLIVFVVRPWMGSLWWVRSFQLIYSAVRLGSGVDGGSLVAH